MMTDIEIAQSVEMKPITEIAKSAGIDDKYLEQYGKYKAKIDLALAKESDKKDGKLILVTAITPTPAGEGKTTTTIGLADAMAKIGKNVLIVGAGNVGNECAKRFSAFGCNVFGVDILKQKYRVDVKDRGIVEVDVNEGN